ncbi:MAG: integration host factor subunit alpha [Gammaproteobacteria bacterium]|nr:integration host factor subunit alpha [Gammaproteobacteria bacterium]|tara:strand:- start:46 stop:348 length:303 start_codon:yes stop_codon:yes gene_type:complete
MTITKNTLVELLHDEVGLNKREAKEFIEMFFESIKSNLESGNDIKISGFGNFILRNKSARPGRNPKTGEEVTIKERRVVTFKSGLKLKTKLEGFDSVTDE